jgi:ribosomal protein S18 acetylase RimI-like enzyme
MCDHLAVLVRAVHDRDELAELLRRDPALHTYELGDLDDFFWPYTAWYRHGDQVALLYHGGGMPTLIALASAAGIDDLAALVRGLAPLLPRRLYAHLSPAVVETLADHFQIRAGGRHRKLALTDPDRLAAVGPAGEVLTRADLSEVADLYAAAYPGNWFDPRMIDTGHYVGIRRHGELLAVAGVHVWSATYRVAALGNVTTHPRARRAGLARAAVGAVCRRLVGTVDHITLNVAADNPAALALYEGLGFTPIAEYEECGLTAR